MLKTIEEISLERGEEAERRVEKVLERLKTEGKINNFLKTQNYSYFDRKGIDFLIFLEDRRIFLQVKSSYYGATRHYQRGEEEGMVVPVIVVDPLKNDDNLKQEILDIVYGEEKEGKEE